MALSESTGDASVGGARNWSLAGLASRARALACEQAFVIILLSLTLTTRLLWAAIIPIWQTPDETAHYAYIQSLGEHLTLTPDDDLHQEVREVDSLTGLGSVQFHPDTTQLFAADSLDGPNEDAIEELPGDLRAAADGGRTNPATEYPPTYYLIASVVYRAASGFDVFAVMFSLRALSALLSTATMLVGYLTARRFFRDDRLAMVAALIVALSPMYAFAGMSVNPDVLVWLPFSIFLYLVTYALDEGLSPRVNIGIALTIVLGLWVKQTFLIAVPMYGIFIGIMYLKRSLPLRDAIKYGGATALGIALLDGWLYLSGIIGTSPEYPGGVREDRSIQGFVRHIENRWSDYSWTFDTAWGNFGWLDTPLSATVFDLIRFGCGVAAIGLVFYLLYTVARRQPDWKALCYVALSVTYVSIYVVLNYIRVTGGEPWLLQGRYFFPIIVPLVALLMRGFLWYVPGARARDVILVALVIGIVWLNADVIFRYVVPRYYL